MIRFVDLETGNTFDGSDQYIFWFDNEQSINLIYSKPICFISDKRIVNVSIENNDTFKLIDNMRLGISAKYHNINDLYVNSLQSYGEVYQACYVHIIYITCSSNYDGEYIGEFYIDGETYKIGADFYGENESLYVNLSNNGIEIPESIQKAIYPVNVKEDKRDNITLNRKWKELLSNYWEIVANKGSYKSLYNSLNWFEWGDVLRLCELWKYDDYGLKYEAQDLQSILKDKYEESKNDFAKTTYIALYCSLEKIKTNDGKIQYDDEKNPILEKISHKWSNEDLSLKMSLLGSFYETYFMPIHLDLIHSTIENMVFANTTSLDVSAVVDRTDYIYQHHDVKCNVKDGDVFYLDDKVNCYANPKTLFRQTVIEKIKYDINGNRLPVVNKEQQFRYYIDPNNIIGVDKAPGKIDKNSPNFNKDLTLYAAQLYSGPGVIIDFEVEIPLMRFTETEKDYIKSEKIIIYRNGSNTKILTDYKILKDNIVKFSLFRPTIGNYTILLQFDSAKGYIYTKKVNFVVKDTEHDDIRVYRVVHKNNDQISKINCFKENGEINDYITSRSRTVYKNGELGYPGSKYINYIPALKKDTINIPKLYKNKGDFNNETDYAEYLRGCISDLDKKNIDDIRNQIINKHDGVCTNHLLIINCRMTKIDSIANADKVSTELFYIDNNVYDENNRVWNNTDDGPLGYKLSKRSVYHKKTINHWKDIYAAIEENYKIVHLWKGVHNPNIVGSYYLICVSKKFGFNLDQLLYKIGSKSIDALKYFKDNYMMNLNEYSNSAHLYNNYIYRDDNIFVPCYHELVELNASREQDINKFTITDKDALCVIPTIERSKNLSGYSWEFINMSDPNRNSIKLKNSIMEPFIANETEKFLDPGYYTIKFNYNLGSKVNTITLDSAFKKI